MSIAWNARQNAGWGNTINTHSSRLSKSGIYILSAELSRAPIKVTTCGTLD